MRFTRSQLMWLGVALVAGALGWVLLLKPPPKPEAVIRQKVVRMARAAEEKQLGGVMEEISQRFRSSEGLGRDELRGFLAGQLFRGTWVRIFLVDMEVEVTSSSTAEFSGKFIFGRSDAKSLKDLARDSVLSSYQIDAKVEREEDGEWRFVSARYQPIDAAPFL